MMIVLCVALAGVIWYAGYQRGLIVEARRWKNALEQSPRAIEEREIAELERMMERE